MKQLDYQLSQGYLRLTVEKEVEPFETLLGIGERINPKRPFMFVSKVTGRYVPTSLGEMIRVSSLLGAQVPKDLLTGNVTLLSLSETALGLGSLVHKYFKDEGMKVLNAFTSRHMIAAPIMSKFEEPHSHLPVHYVYKSYDEEVNKHMASTDTLILVDDEITTGNTLLNLYKSLNLKSVKRLIILTLADWSPDSVFELEGIDVVKFSLIGGTYKWYPETSAAPVDLPYDPTILHKQENLITVSPHSTRLPSFVGLKVRPPSSGRFRLPFDSEQKDLLCIYYNEMLPQAIEAILHDRPQDLNNVYFMAASSSPLEVGRDIQSKIELPGYYSDIPVYLYNYKEVMQSLENPSLSLVYETDDCSPHKNAHFKTPVYDLIQLAELPNQQRSIFSTPSRHYELRYALEYLANSKQYASALAQQTPTTSQHLTDDLACLF